MQLTEPAKGKPGDGPTWWSLDDLLAFRKGNNVAHTQLRENGWKPPRGDRRTHVAIDSDTSAADAGKLFQTEGLDLDVPHNASGSSAGGLRLLVSCSKELCKTLVHLGGERRLAELQPEPKATWPAPPKGWLAES